MLEPESRHLLTDALRPPDGYAVERALATTYTLDLTSVLLAPLAMAAYDQRHATELDGAATPLALLESIRRHAEHTTVLCQAAGIHVPPAYPKLAAFAEGCIAEVAPPAGRTFHPKIWVLRFVNDDGGRRHRFACLSRNLTGDRSWDTVLICDEDPHAEHTLDAEPISTFVEELLERTVRPLATVRREQLRELCESLRGARLALPNPFTEGRVVPLGTPSGDRWPLPETADTWAVISPFLDVTSVARLPRSGGERILLSRPDTFERLGSRTMADLELRVLQPPADTAQSDEDTETAPAANLSTGLHAKVFAWQAEGRAHVLTGSANCTGAAFGGNIELSVMLSGPIAACGVHALVGDVSSGFLRITQGYAPREVEPQPDPVYRAERMVELWHAELAACTPRLLVTEGESGFDLRLEVELPVDPDGLVETTMVRPVGARSIPFRPLAGGPSWRGLSLAGLTPYLAVSTTVNVEGTTVTKECVLLCEVVDAPQDRLARLLRELLARQEDILRYLALLLGDPSVDDLLDRLLQVGPGDEEESDNKHGSYGVSFDDLVLLEPLVRAAARGDDALLRAHRLLEDLRDPNGELPQLSAEFLDLWRLVWEASER